MDREKYLLRFATCFLALALLIKMLDTTPLAARVRALGVEDLVSVMLFMEAGRVVKVPAPEETQAPAQTQPAQQVSATVVSDPQLPLTFSQEDLALLEVNNLTGYAIDPEASLSQPLHWDLTQEGPAVLILHTHATESYRNTGQYVESAAFRTLDENHNVLSIGTEVANILEAGGIHVLHDTTLHDDPSYNDAYYNARQAITDTLSRYPSIRLVLDLHRDAAENDRGEQIAYTSSLGGQTAAQLMIVAGSDAGGLSYPNWQENLEIAVKLQTVLQRRAPGICRPLNFRSQRYNQDLHPQMLLVEVGSAGNTHEEAMLAARELAYGILDMAYGTKWE